LPVDEDFGDGIIPYEFVSEAIKGNNCWEPYQPDQNYPVQPNSSIGMMRYTGTSGAISQLSTRQLDLFGIAGSAMDFWYYHDTTANLDRGYTNVYVVADGDIILEKTLYKKTGSLHGWMQYTVDLNPYITKQCVWIMFEAMVGNSGQAQYIDRIYIYGTQNLALDTILIPSLTACNLKNKEVQLLPVNATLLGIDFSITSTEIYWEVRKNAAVINSGIYTLDTGYLEGYATDTIRLTTMDFDTGTYNLVAWIDMPIDLQQADDTTRSTLVISPAIIVTAEKISAENACLIKGTPVQQKVTVKNTGNMDLSNIELILSISSSMATQIVYKSLNVNLSPGDSIITTFDNYNVPDDKDYIVEIFAYLGCDSALVNNKDIFLECADLDDLLLLNFVKPTYGEIDTVGKIKEIEV